MLAEVHGLVLRTTDVGEFDRIITLYTRERGILSASARGARSLKSKKMSSTAQFCYSTFILEERQDKWRVKEATLIDSFFGLSESLEALALGCYIVDVMSEAGTAEPEPDLLRLGLNSLYALANRIADPKIVKGAFEMRVAGILGFTPAAVECSVCGTKAGDFFFDVMAGALLCRECYRRTERTGTPLTDSHESHIVYQLTPSAKDAIVYSLYSPIEKLFSFRLDGDDIHLFSRAAEGYLLNHLERGFKTLDFYNEVKR